jgi:PAS domain S-box-containing protein
MKIRTKILTGYFLIFTVTILLGIGILYSQLKTSLQRNIETELANSASSIAAMVRTAVDVSIRNHLRAVAEKNREILAGLYALQQAGELTEAQAQAQAARLFGSQRIGQTGYLYCLNSKGVVTFHPRPGNLGRDVSEFAFVREQTQVREGYLEYQWMNPGETHLRPKALYMTYFAPWDWIISASSYREEFRSLVNVMDFHDGILALRFGHDGYAAVFDDTGNAVIHPHLKGNVLDVQDAHGLYLIREVVARKSGLLYYWWRNPGEAEAREKIITFNYLPELGWIAGTTGYADEFFAPLRSLRLAAMVALPLVLLLGLPFSLWVGLSVSRPLEALRRSLARASEGDFTQRVTPDGTQEMAQLGGYFNGFMDRLDQYNTSLRREVAERQQAEQREARARAHLKDVVDSMASVVIGLDGEGCVTLWNRRAAEEFGVAPELALGRPAGEVCPMWGLCRDAVAAALRENRSVVRDKLPGRRGGRTVYSKIEATPLWASGDAGVVLRIVDITDRVRMEEVMVQTEKMMSVGGLAAGMAHEINNPLGGILQGVQNVQRRMAEDLPANREAAREAGTTLEALRGYMQRRGIFATLTGIRESGLRAARIVANMLEFSRRSESNRMPCDVTDLLDKAVELAESDYDLKKRYDFRKIKVVRDYEQGLPPVNCAGTEIEQVFLNLLRNAAQAMGGVHDDSAPTLRLGVHREGDWVRVEVADNGPGMTEITRKRIFEPFFTTKDVGEGTGLGLSVSYFIVTRNHGGTFAVESEPGQGATFIIRLPL